MPVRSRSNRTLLQWLISIGACLAVVGQLSVAFATIAEAREGQGMGAHVEQAGTSTHYAHGDACAICQARSLQGLTTRAAELFSSSSVRSSTIESITDRVVASDLFSPGNPRAPPSNG